MPSMVCSHIASSGMVMVQRPFLWSGVMRAPTRAAKTSSMQSQASIVSSRVPSQSKMNPILFNRLIGCLMAWSFLDDKACSILGI